MTERVSSNRLTKTVFAEGIGMIAARWNREIDPSISAVMAEWLAARQCTADEFITGVKRAIAAEREAHPRARASRVESGDARR
jgi:hypothetical protein